ncbi:hypothetical protein J7J81_00730 [bacterium]|nr:hypothetical protein [bacterium]
MDITFLKHLTDSPHTYTLRAERIVSSQKGNSKTDNLPQQQTNKHIIHSSLFVPVAELAYA